MFQNLEFNGLEFLVNLFNFIILMAIVYQVVILGLWRMIEARSRAIQARFEDAKQLQREATLADVRRQEQLDGLLDEITEFRELTEKDRIRGELKTAAESEQEARHIIELAEREARDLAREAEEDFQRRISAEAVKRVERKLAKMITPEVHRDLVQGFLRKVGSLGAN